MTRNLVRKYGPKLAAFTAPLALVGVAHAELPAAIATGVTAAQTDGLSLIGILAAMAAAVFLIAALLRKFGLMPGKG